MSSGAASTPDQLVIWRISDRKPGHDNQSRGLVQALARRRSVSEYMIAPLDPRRALCYALRRRFPETDALPSPDLIVGAGHGTHGALLAARRARGGRSVVLMRPTLPLSWFDLCIVPAHDRPPVLDNVLVTQGVLNSVTPGGSKDPGAGLFLIGGPSRHYGWDTDELATQIDAIVAGGSQRWVLATSRRTPAETEAALRQRCSDRVQLVPWRDTAPDWLPTQLTRAATAWVSADSVSMVYEALSAGAACGLLRVPIKVSGRVRAGVDALVRQGLVITYDQWRHGAAPAPPPEPFDEAGRCAAWIEHQWLRAS